ncbi:hypothetical protein SAMN05660748_2901 [Blastococcus aggregatus]|uniref:Antitoxin Xre/MbcA/ParS-like toxin-binding domain-containing protein n=1 Tax=Blastococcus aggregatus TaxID=38502 RepID=A0A285VCD3_9ACTN|nr:hypothetical protein [Blastococcus aggregatus]SOC50161.1 hypothetical protein SAMN05660748_2901 [Blastococcus aggregatus]
MEEQAGRLADFRARLSGGALTLGQLASRRGEQDPDATGDWVAVRRLERSLIACVLPDRSLVVPAFQLTEAAEPRPELRPLLERLLGAGIDGWTAWTWLTQPSSLLSGEVPERVAVADQERALRASARFAADRDA